MASRTVQQSNSQSWATRLAALFNIQAGEIRPVGLLAVLYFILIIGFVFLQATTFGLFIAEFGAQRLPYAYLSIAVLASLVAFSYLKLSNKIDFPRLVTLNLAFLSLMCLLFWAGLGSSFSRWFIFLLPFWFQTQINLVNLVVWPLAGRIFDLRQAKRVFGLVGAGNWLANILGGFIVAPFVKIIGIHNLLLITAGVTALAIWILRIILRSSLPQAAAAPVKARPAGPAHTKQAQPGMISYFKDPYIRMIFIFILFWWISFYFIDNMFYDRAGAQFEDAVQLAGFIGQLLSATGVVALITTTFISGRVVMRYGLRAGLLAMPLLVTISIAGMALVGTFDPHSPLLFWLVTAAKLFNVALGFSISQSTSTLLYQALPRTQSSQTQTVAEGIIQPIAIGLAGLMLLLLNTVLHLGVIVLSYVFLGIAAGWIIAIVLLTAQYPKVLTRALARRQLGNGLHQLMDATSIQALKQNLTSTHPGVVFYAMNHLQEWDRETWKNILAENLPALLAHPEAQVRQKVLENVEQLNLPGSLQIIDEALKKETDPEVIAAGLCTLAASGESNMLAQVVRYIQDRRMPVQRGALVALLRHGGIDGVLEAGRVFNQLVQSDHVHQRMQAADVLGEVGSAQFYQPVLQLLNDPQPAVKRAAVRAAGRIQNPRLWPALLDACTSSKTQHQAEQALIAAGPAVLPTIEAAFKRLKNNSSAHLGGIEIRRFQSLVEVCGHIGGQAAVEILLTQLETRNMELRQRILSSLNRCGYRAASSDNRLNLLLREEAHLAAWLVAYQQNLETSNYSQQLSNILVRLLRDVRDRVLLILSLQYDAQSLIRARAALEENDSAQGVFALEVIENQIPSGIKGWVMPLVEQSTPREKLARFQSAGIQALLPHNDEILMALLNGNIHLPTDNAQTRPIIFSAWVRASLLYLIGSQKIQTCLSAVQAACNSDDYLVSESAGWALSRLVGNNTEGVVMLSPIEKVLILKSASVFNNVPDDVLADVAFLLEEMDAAVNEQIINKGDLGDSMYILVSGKVRIHDNERTLNELGEGDVFGEMALLDPEPRSASVTAIEPTRLLRLEQEPFVELIAEHPEVATGIIRNLARYVRARVLDLSRLDARLRDCEGVQ